MAEVALPQLGETVTEGTITKWFKDIGDAVAEDEPLFEVSTDKVDSEVPSPAGGYLTEIRIGEGETVDVGTVLAVVSDTAPASGDGPEAEESSTGTAATAAEPETAAEPAPTAEPAPAAGREPAEPAPAAGSEPAEPGPEPVPAASQPAPASAEAAPSGTAGSGLLLSPVVRRMVNDHDLDPATIEGTGPGGRITRSDVEAVIARQGDAGRDGGREVAEPAEAPAPSPPTAPAPAPSRPPSEPATPAQPARAPAPTAGEGDRVEALNNIRRRTGEHMVRSKATSPHVLTVVEVDYEGVERVRSAHKARFRDQEGTPLTYLPFVARALVDALDEFPHLNASVGDGELIVHETVNLGIAVDLDFQGLIVPVITGAEDLRLAAIARSVHDLAERARTKKLGADEITGGTVTITNAGGYGTSIMGAIINQPQVMILSTDGVFRKPVAVTAADGTEAIAIHSVGNLAMSWDHRAFDGAYASAFLQRLREIIETRDWEAEL